MNANLRDLIAALPQEETGEERSEAHPGEQHLQEIFASLARRPVPTGSLHRLWTVGELSTQVALAYLCLWVRQWFSRADQRKQQLMDTNLRVALKTIHRLGYLRGAAAKLGQTLGNLPEIFPDQIVSTLDRLHFEAPPMHFSLLREMVRNELGKDPENLFDSFQKDAFAAASIGQVHLARLKSGEQVAVKIQYPGIAKAIDSDLRNLRTLLFPARLGKDWEYTKAQFEVIRDMLRMEVDYEQEAENTHRARDVFEPEDGIVVPRVYDEYSTKRVLTTDFIKGLHLPAFLATNPSQASRDRFGTKMYLAYARMYTAHMNYADPHSGNYVFMSDGRLGLLDFGCIQHYDSKERDILKTAELMADDPAQLAKVLRKCGVPEVLLADKEYLALMQESCDWSWEPVLAEGPFDFSNEKHLKRGIEIFSHIVKKRYTQNHPIWVYFNRSLIGLWALLYQMRARVDVRQVFGRA